MKGVFVRLEVICQGESQNHESFSSRSLTFFCKRLVTVTHSSGLLLIWSYFDPPPMPSTTDLFDPTSKAYKKARRQYHKATKNRSSDVESDWTEFRAAEKRYKSRFPPPDLCNVLDLATLDRSRDEEVKQGVWMGKHDAVEHVEIPARSGSAKVYAIPRIPGAITPLTALHSYLW